jgi:hypothetical protein
MWMATVYACLLNPKPMQTQEVGQVVAILLGVHVSCWGCSVFRNKDQQARELIDGRGGAVGSSSSDTFSWIDLWACISWLGSLFSSVFSGFRGDGGLEGLIFVEKGE